MGKYFSTQNLEAPFIIEELEINPFAFTDFLMIPLDGLCRFSLPKAAPLPRPIAKIHNLLHPEHIGIMGVSSTRRNFGRIILDNIMEAGFPKDNITVFHEKESSIGDIACVPNLEAQKTPLDLLVLAIGAESLPELVHTIVDKNCAHAVMLIAGNMGETESSLERAVCVKQDIMLGHAQEHGGPIFLGANCMGVVSHPGKYDTWFIPKEKFSPAHNVHSIVSSGSACNGGKKYHRAALISQSGAFMLHRLSQMPDLSPAYMVSMGNQSDLTLGDMLEYFSRSDEVDVIAVYAEGLNDTDRLAFVDAVRKAICAGKMVVFYKAGRTVEGKHATSGHTASLAGDYMVCESCVREAGAIVARTFTEFQNVFMLAEHLHHTTIGGRRLAAVSGAGFEAVGMADSIQSDEYSMSLCSFSAECTAKIQAILQENKLDSLVTVQNPLDINPAATDKVHVDFAQVLLEDKGIDALVMSFGPLSPSVHSLPMSEMPLNIQDQQSMIHLAEKMMQNIPKGKAKPLIGIVDGGALFNAYRHALMRLGIPVFSVCDEAIAALALYMEARIKISTHKKILIFVSISMKKIKGYSALCLAFVFLVGCAAPYGRAYMQGEIQKVQSSQGFVTQVISTTTFHLYALLRPAKGESDTLHVYIEGDGLAWRTRTQPSSDPTPTQATALHVAQNDPSTGPVLYLARPCQYVNGADRKMCSQKFWTGARFAPEVITATNQAIDRVKAQTKAQSVVLVGYSGGGSVAALVAARRNDVTFLGSFAGNLDVDAWTEWHKVTPLRNSLKPLKSVARIAALPQRHVMSYDDKIIPPQVNTAFCNALAKPASCQNISGLEHDGAWETVWNYNYVPTGLIQH